MKTLDYLPNTHDTGGWKTRHMRAISQARTFSIVVNQETVIVRALDTWVGYAIAHQARFESPIGEDYVLGPAWARWGFALRELLNGETGRLDCGTLDTILCDNLAEQGYNPDDGAPQS